MDGTSPAKAPHVKRALTGPSCHHPGAGHNSVFPFLHLGQRLRTSLMCWFSLTRGSEQFQNKFQVPTRAAPSLQGWWIWDTVADFWVHPFGTEKMHLIYFLGDVPETRCCNDHSIHCFSGCCDKRPYKGSLRNRFPFGLCLRGIQSIMVVKTVSRSEAACLIASIGRKQREQEVEIGYKPSSPTYSNPLPPARLHLLKVPAHLLKVPQPFKITPPSGDRVFKHVILWGHFSFKPLPPLGSSVLSHAKL